MLEDRGDVVRCGRGIQSGMFEDEVKGNMDLQQIKRFFFSVVLYSLLILAHIFILREILFKSLSEYFHCV